MRVISPWPQHDASALAGIEIADQDAPAELLPCPELVEVAVGLGLGGTLVTTRHANSLQASMTISATNSPTPMDSGGTMGAEPSALSPVTGGGFFGILSLVVVSARVPDMAICALMRWCGDDRGGQMGWARGARLKC